MGTLRLPLRGIGLSNAQYRLRQALISVTGPTARLFDTETNPDQFGLSYDLPAGHYEVKLTGQTGENTWQMERLDEATMTWSNIDATLVPPNPASVDVIPNGFAFVGLQFLLESDDVVFGTGTLQVGLSIEDRPQCSPFMSPTGCLMGQKCLSVLNIPGVAVCQAAGPVPTRGACMSDNDCADGRCVFFADHTECLPDCLTTAAPGEVGACPSGGFCSAFGIGDLGLCFF